MPSRAVYLDYIRAAGATTETYLSTSIEKWQESFRNAGNSDHPLFGYAATGAPAAAAAVDAFLYQVTGDPVHAARARQALLLPRQLAKIFPPALAARHPEYHQAVPPMDGLFAPPSYIPAYERIRESDVLDQSDHDEIPYAATVADSLHPLFPFPGMGGTQSRFMLRALSLALATARSPPYSAAGRRCNRLAEDSWGPGRSRTPWAITQSGCAALFTYAEVTGRPGLFELPATFY